MAQKLGELIDKISIHALREEGDRPAGHPAESPAEFLSTPSARRATSSRAVWMKPKSFLSTPSARRATNAKDDEAFGYQISIHALREEGDLRAGFCFSMRF